MKKVLGVGKVVNGRMTYVGENGGFSRPVKREEPKQEQKEEIEIVFSFVQGDSEIEVVPFKLKEVM